MRIMLLKRLNNALVSCIMTEAFYSGCIVNYTHPFVYFEVKDWEQFLHIVWNAYADFSRDDRGQFITDKLPVSVEYKDHTYETKVWYDPDCKGLRYVSLY